jgi:hypothetical protein
MRLGRNSREIAISAKRRYPGRRDPLVRLSVSRAFADNDGDAIDTASDR